MRRSALFLAASIFFGGLVLVALAVSPAFALGTAPQVPTAGIDADAAGIAAPVAAGPRPIRLRARVFSPPPGVDPIAFRQAQAARAAGASSAHLVAQFRRVPDPALWRKLAAAGVARVSYLGDNNWFVRVALAGNLAGRLGHAVRLADATAMTVLQPTDKAAPRLAAMGFQPGSDEAERRPGYAPWAYDRQSDLLQVVVRFFPDTPPAELAEIVHSLHRGPAAPLAIDPTFWSLQLHPADLGGLLAVDEVHDADLGPVPKLTLLDDARWKTGVDEVQKIDFTQPPPDYPGYALSGKGVSISNGEGLDTNNPDFWDHPLGGNPTPRWASSCSAAGDAHGTMTAGIALGNGFSSAAQGGTPYQWRGVAPAATFACEGTTEDVSNHSFVQTFGAYDSSAAAIDSQIRGDNGGDQRPQVWAVANQGIQAQYGSAVGYYSVYAPAKNPIVVANLSAATLRWMYSSLGPTWDGRIKPDLGAPGSKEGFPDKTQLLFDLDWIKIDQGSGSSLLWTFDGDGTLPGWRGGWGEAPWWGGQNLGPISQIVESTTRALRVPLLAPPYGVAFQNRPLVGTLTAPNETPLNITGSSKDVVSFLYRLESTPLWRPASASFHWVVGPDTYNQHNLGFDVIADGAWHQVTLAVGNEATWNGVAGINYLYLRFGGKAMLSTGTGTTLIADGGSSAAAPVVAGAVALLIEQMTRQPFGVHLGDHTPSPFWTDAPGTGVPLPSTFKALLIQGARDLAYLPHVAEPDNPDTHAPTVYHQGPDLATGYGVIDVAESSRILAAHTAAQPYIVERPLHSRELHSYAISVPPNPRAPLKVTLAWDDPAADPLWDEVAPALVNGIHLTLVAPDGTVHYPYSLDQPYSPSNPSLYPSQIEPQPITAADIHPARQDQANDLDNVQQVYVETPQPGLWQVKVEAFKLYYPPQRYSLILGAPALPANHLAGGKVVFSSDRVRPPQLFVQAVGSTAPPMQVTREPSGARLPVWSSNGKYIAYITPDVIVGPDTSDYVDDLMVITGTGTVLLRLPALRFISARSLGYEQWSDDGRSMVVTYWSSFSKRGLALLDFGQPYHFFTPPKVTLLVGSSGGQNADLNAGEAIFSHDGNFIYFTADSSSAPSQLFRIPATGGTAAPVFGNGAPIRRAFAPSLSPDGTRLIYNSEMWREDPVLYQDEELLEVGLLSGVIRRLTAEPGNQYGWFAKHGAGEMVVQSNSTRAGKYDLFLEENGMRVPLDTGAGGSSNDGAPGWWKTPCSGGTALWYGDEPAGCKFATWGQEQKSLCGSWVVLGNSGSGSCTLCVDAQWVAPILGGVGVSLKEGPDPATATPAVLTCR